MGRAQRDYKSWVINLGRVIEKLNPQAGRNFSRWLGGQQAALYRAVSMDPSPPPVAGTDEPLASVCSQRDSADPLGTHSAVARAGNFALQSQREKCPGHSVHLISCTSNSVKAHRTPQVATFQMHML